MNIEELKQAIAENESKMQELRDNMQECTLENSRLCTELFKLQWAVYPGVKVTNGRDEFIVTRTDKGYRTPYVYGNKIKKDGTPSKQERWVSNWKLVDESATKGNKE
jgi:hypothetical protein